MSYEYPSMPAYDPCGPDNDGFADIKLGWDYVELTLARGEKLRIPGITIERGGMTVTPGSDRGVNRVQLTLLAGKITCADDAEWTEQVPAKRRSA